LVILFITTIYIGLGVKEIYSVSRHHYNNNNFHHVPSNQNNHDQQGSFHDNHTENQFLEEPTYDHDAEAEGHFLEGPPHHGIPGKHNQHPPLHHNSMRVPNNVNHNSRSNHNHYGNHHFNSDEGEEDYGYDDYHDGVVFKPHVQAEIDKCQAASCLVVTDQNDNIVYSGPTENAPPEFLFGHNYGGSSNDDYLPEEEQEQHAPQAAAPQSPQPQNNNSNNVGALGSGFFGDIVNSQKAMMSALRPFSLNPFL